jgi:hypothetical protein
MLSWHASDDGAAVSHPVVTAAARERQGYAKWDRFDPLDRQHLPFSPPALRLVDTFAAPQ